MPTQPPPLPWTGLTDEIEQPKLASAARGSGHYPRPPRRCATADRRTYNEVVITEGWPGNDRSV